MEVKIELDFISVDEKLPVDDWKKEPWYTEDVGIIGTFFAILENDEPNDDPEIGIVDYRPAIGFVYRSDINKKYDNDPWRVTWWAKIPIIKPEDIK